jgi:hypothetical protein
LLTETAILAKSAIFSKSTRLAETAILAESAIVAKSAACAETATIPKRFYLRIVASWALFDLVNDGECVKFRLRKYFQVHFFS